MGGKNTMKEWVMEQKEKSEIQKVVDLLEDNGYHVFKAAEEGIDENTADFNHGIIQLRIIPWKIVKKL
jgi:hypothetical protein